MKKIFLFLLLTGSLFSQEINSEYFRINGEVYFSFANPGRALLDELTTVVSLDYANTDSVRAYANRQQFEKFKRFLLPFKHLPHPGDVKDVKMSNNPEGLEAWDAYPTYEAYVAMMQGFAQSYPSICRLVDAGSSVLGRKIYFVVISDSVYIREPEPQLMYTSSMHGDETTGYVLMLRLIDSLLTSYGTNPRITNLVNQTEIWINPLANPDGTYRTGNHTVSGARRYNNNNVDINRNFPDPAAGEHPDGNAWQPETIVMMNIAKANKFVLSANFHGGAEVVNYPWDTWVRRAADDQWWQFVSHMYADTAQAYSPSNYMSGFNDGITNGYDWYRITGGRQDYMNYFMRCREVTLEISNTKLLSASLLPAHWEYNKRSLLNYLENALYGIHGRISTGPNLYDLLIRTNIKIAGLDIDNSDIYADSANMGYYVRMLAPGTYTVQFIPQDTLFPTALEMQFSNITVSNFNRTVLDIIVPIPLSPVELTSFTGVQNQNGITLKWSTASEENNRGFEIQRAAPVQTMHASSSQHTSPVQTMHASSLPGEWTILSFISGNGTTADASSYIYTDLTPAAGKNLYRLRQIDFDGTETFSPVIEVEFGLPAEFYVSDNYPNPFNPSTQFTVSLPSESKVLLSLYSLSGELVSSTDFGTRPAGLSQLNLEAAGLVSGAYFYTIQAGEYTKTGKITLLK